MRAAALCLVLVLAACGGSGGVARDRDGGDAVRAVRRVEISPTEAGPQGRVPQFVVECGFSHMGAADPIVHPGMAHMGHLHVFFGNTGTGADSTAASLSRGGTTCDQQLDRAAYWAPALLDHGRPVTPTKAVAYYRPGVGIDPAAVRPYPFGLKMLGGDQTATAPQPIDEVAWSCGAGSVRTVTPATCPAGRPLRLAVAFPDCWDGRHLDSSDHTAHVARSRDGACPRSHPVPIPQLLLAITWPVTGTGHALSLASGSVLTGHADFINAWDETALQTEVSSCLRRGIVCGVAYTRS